MTTELNKNAHGPPGGWYAWVIWGVASLFYLYEYFLRVAPSVMVHPLMIHFQISAASLGALAAFYFYIYSPMQLGVGILLDRFGGGKILPIATGLAAIGCLVFGSTGSYWVAAGGRLLQGMGSSFAFVGAIYVASNWFPEKRFALLSGLTTMLGMVGAVAGQAPVAAIVEKTGWQITWIGCGIVGLGLGVLLWVIIPLRPKWAKKQKILHGRKVTPVSVFTQLGRVLSNRQTWFAGIFGGMIYVPTSTFAALWGVPFIEAAYDLPRVTSAAAVSMIFVGWILGAPLAGWWSDRIRRRTPPMILGAVGVLLTSLAVIYIPNLPTAVLFSLMFSIGIFSGGQVSCFAVAYESNSANAKGSSLAVTNMLVMITGAILQPAVGWLLDSRYQDMKIVGAVHFKPADYHYALMVVPISVLLALVFALLTKDTCGKPPKA